MYFLCDASGFYSSAEKVMRPDLRNKPVVTLSKEVQVFNKKWTEGFA